MRGLDMRENGRFESDTLALVSLAL